MGQISPFTSAQLHFFRIKNAKGQAIGALQITAHFKNREGPSKQPKFPMEPSGPHNRTVISTRFKVDFSASVSKGDSLVGDNYIPSEEETQTFMNIVKSLEKDNGLAITKDQKVIDVEDSDFAKQFESYLQSQHNWTLQTL